MRQIGCLFLAALCTIALGVGCGDDDGDNQNNNDLQISDDYLKANTVDPDLSCFGSADPAHSYTVDTEVTGVVLDYEEDFPVAGIVVAIYATRADLISDTPFDESAESDVNGAYTINVPAGVQRVHWRMTDPTGLEYFDTVEMEDPVAGMPPGPPTTIDKERAAISWNTVETVPGTLGIARIEGRGIIAATLYDCARAHVENAAVRIYDGPATDPDRTLISVHGENMFYFNDGWPSRLQSFTSPDGQLIAANFVETGNPVTVELWGRAESAWLPSGWEDCSEGCLISSQEVPVLGEVIVISDLQPLYTSN